MREGGGSITKWQMYKKGIEARATQFPGFKQRTKKKNKGFTRTTLATNTPGVEGRETNG